MQSTPYVHARRGASAAAVLAVLACRAPDHPDTTQGSGTDCVPLEPAEDTEAHAPEEVVVPFVAGPEVLETAQTFFATRGHGGYSCDPGVAIGERRCALDIHAVRWDPASSAYTRSRTRPDEPNPLPFSDDVMWGLPLRSPVDGVVLACWRGMPDDDDDTDDIDCPGGEGPCIQGGNHVQILSDDGELWFLGHLQQDSIPRRLCPLDETFLYDTDPKACELPVPWEGLRQSSRLDLRGIDPIPVTRGEVVGRAGTSGSGLGVHVHVHRKPFEYDEAGNPCEAPSLPLAFESLWVQPRRGGIAPSDAWHDVAGQRLPIDGSQLLLWPGELGEPPRPGCE